MLCVIYCGIHSSKTKSHHFLLTQSSCFMLIWWLYPKIIGFRGNKLPYNCHIWKAHSRNGVASFAGKNALKTGFWGRERTYFGYRIDQQDHMMNQEQQLYRLGAHIGYIWVRLGGGFAMAASSLHFIHKIGQSEACALATGLGWFSVVLPWWLDLTRRDYSLLRLQHWWIIVVNVGFQLVCIC